MILAANQVWWTWEVEDTFMKVKKGDKMGLKNYSRKLHAQISEVVVKVQKIVYAHAFLILMELIFYNSIISGKYLKVV